MTSLQKELNFFIYSTVFDQDFINKLKKEYTSGQTSKWTDKRWQTNLSDKQQQRINSMRYYEGFKLSRLSSDKESTYKYLDVVVHTYGLTLNTGAFLVTCQLVGDDEQAKYWKEQVIEGRVIGAYGQTQLGHGSNVKELETVATYDKETQSFIINSPTITSAKFWPGVLGQFATHAVIQAKTFVEGKNIGVQTFAIELRNNKLEPLPNIELFDIGPKLGFERVDNGGVIFKNVRIPRRAMLMRYIKVTKQGVVEGLENTQAIKYGYGSMLNLRVKLTYSFALKCILEPAINLYQILKQQGTAENAVNRKLITDSLCVGYGIVIANRNTHNIFNELLKQIANKNYAKADKHLINCHIISSTFKALSSRTALNITSHLQTHNSLCKFKSSMLPYSFFNYIPSATYEGDNTVLLQQTAKFLLFKFNLQKKINNLSKQFKQDDWKALAAALQFILIQKLKKVKDRMEKLGQKGVHFQKIWNELQQNALIEAANIWGYMMFLQSLEIILPQIKKHQAFYAKICKGFTSYIANTIPQLEVYGFTVEKVQVWKLFTDEEYRAMLEINAPIQREADPFKLYSRPEKWLEAKL